MELSTSDRELLTWLRDHGVALSGLAERLLPPTVYTIREGQDLQVELRALPVGVTVQLDGTFLGNFEVPEGLTIKGGTLVAPVNGPALIPASRTALYGVTVTANVQTSELVRYEQVTDVLMEGCIVKGHETYGAKRGIRLNAANATIRNTSVTDCKAAGADSQAICGWSYTKNVLIADCLLEGAGENVMFGGADSDSVEALPQDIVLERCTLRKPLEWRGSAWTVKNLFELKAAKRVTMRQCLLENLWKAAQVGYAVNLKSVHQDGHAPWSEVSDVLIEDTIIRNVGGGFTLHRNPVNNGYTGVPMARVTLRNNRVEISQSTQGGTGYFVYTYGVDDLVIERNTVQTDGNITMFFDGPPAVGFRLVGNILPDNAYGVKGTSAGEGKATFTKFAPDGVITDNLFVTGSPWLYPAGNRCEPTLPVDTTGYGATV